MLSNSKKLELEQNSVIVFFQQILRGIGQIMFQENSITGLLFLAGLFFGNYLFALAALVASAMGTMTARLLHFRRDDIDAGLYGFSASLVGVGLLFLYPNSILTWGFLLVGSALAALIQHVFITRDIPGFTFPFILVIWLFFFIINQFQIIDQVQYTDIDISLYNSSTLYSQYNIIVTSFGEVIFQWKPISGTLFLIGVLINNPLAGLFAIFASLLGAITASAFMMPEEQILIGLFGFNAVLTAIALTGRSKSDLIWLFLGIVITVLIHIFLVENNLLKLVGGVFTFPFVFGTWCILLLKKIVVRSKK